MKIRFPIHDDIVATQHLGTCALAYTRQIMIAEDTGAPVGSEPVESAMQDLAVAAIAFTLQIAISEDLGDPKALRQIEKTLVAMFTPQRASKQ